MEGARPAPPPTSGGPLAASAAAVAGGAALVGLAVWLVAEGSVAVWAVPAVVAGGLALALARPSPLVRFAVVVVLQVLQLGGERGLGVGEVVAGLALVGYLGHWYASTWLSGRPVVLSLFDAAALAWGTVGLAAGVALGALFGFDAYDFRADLIATLPFLLYLPAKDACVRERWGGVVVAGVLCTFGLWAAVQNAVAFRTVIADASQLYQIADARFITGETSMTAGLMLSLAGMATARDRRLRGALVALAGVLLGGLILTKSRGFWISNLFGIACMVVVATPRARRRIVAYGLLGVVALGAVAAAFFSEQLVLIVAGTVNRFLSISEAGSGSSLGNRFAESRAAWEMIRVNPVLGYGWGVQVTHYSVIAEGTRHWAFLHNGYLSLWFKTGLWGLGLMLFVWVGAMARAARTARTARPAVRAVALGAGATIAAFTPVAVSSNPFSIFDQVLVVALVLALAHGAADRAAVERSASGGPGGAAREGR